MAHLLAKLFFYGIKGYCIFCQNVQHVLFRHGTKKLSKDY